MFLPTLVMMAKAPRAGLVKTRLAREIGTAEALRFYRANLSSTTRLLSADGRWRFVLSVAPDWAIHEPVWPAGIAAIPQGFGNLGTRMQRVLDRMPPGPVIIIGADIPGIRRWHVADAFKRLGEADAIFGPAHDGGYWLVGVKRRPHIPCIFSNVRWSGPHALEDTVTNLSGKRIAFCNTLADVDTAEDFYAWRRGDRIS